MSSNKVIVHTDGACSGNPGTGGWGVILDYNGTRKELSGGEPLSFRPASRASSTAKLPAIEPATSGGTTHRWSALPPVSDIRDSICR